VFFSITNCTNAVQVLSTKTLTSCALFPNKQLAADPAINLAKHLLAAQLNVKAGACGASTIGSTVTAAQLLLGRVRYAGCKLAPNPDAGTTAQLRAYAAELDKYNNGNGGGCPGCHG
jgi:hypothetical protein